MIYLDHNATTSILPEVLEAMMPPKEVDSQQLRRFRFLL
jgi:cysteine sulfinate desulfinase/cysteine desulfurase-like protein